MNLKTNFDQDGTKLQRIGKRQDEEGINKKNVKSLSNYFGEVQTAAKRDPND
jgi:hypothetical protein